MVVKNKEITEIIKGGRIKAWQLIKLKHYRICQLAD